MVKKPAPTNILVDPKTGSPRWNAASDRLGPKEDFAFEAGSRLLRGRLTLDGLQYQIVQAANDELIRRGSLARAHTLKDVKEHIGKSGPDWYYELQRVSQNPVFLQQLLDQKGRGLTALARKAGPLQAQRRKGYADKNSLTEIRDLIEVLDALRLAIRQRKAPVQSLSSMCLSDINKYRAVLKKCEPTD